jgi:hypothetical protein
MNRIRTRMLVVLALSALTTLALSAPAQAVDTAPPAAPAGLLATAGNAQVVVNWSDNTEPDLHHYDVFRATVPGGPYAKANSIPVTVSAYTDTALVNGTIYYYVVRAFDSAGNGSANSAQVSVMPAPAAPPIVFEGEAMTRSSSKTTSMQVVADSAASAGRALQFRASATFATKQYTVARASDRLVLRMRGASCNGAPQAQIRVDSFATQTITVAATGYTDYVAPYAATNGGAAGTHTVRVTYPSDAKTKSCDRTLYLDKVTVNQI